VTAAHPHPEIRKVPPPLFPPGLQEGLELEQVMVNPMCNKATATATVQPLHTDISQIRTVSCVLTKLS